MSLLIFPNLHDNLLFEFLLLLYISIVILATKNLKQMRDKFFKILLSLIISRYYLNVWIIISPTSP